MEYNPELEIDYWIEREVESDTPEKNLWLAVIFQAMKDGDRLWLETEDCDTVCNLAGVSKDTVRNSPYWSTKFPRSGVRPRVIRPAHMLRGRYVMKKKKVFKKSKK
ncbi:MAG: hypothetical protein MJZ34_14510 [Paludibacteraceae bacterium]|nr:hypothetical protein [Paludibacteraceae bacterium]